MKSHCLDGVRRELKWGLDNGREEKVMIPRGKEHILLEGEGSNSTIIGWGDYINNDPEPNSTTITSVELMATATVTLYADNFVARGIQFLNTYNVGNKNPLRRALAALVGGDKASFHNCTFKGSQDTLCDYLGHHYFENCWIEGSMDFIFGYAQSMYENCILSVVAPDTEGSVSYITAQGRGPTTPGGFVFKDSQVIGSNKAYLGRAYGPISTVIFLHSYMSGIVVPEGWQTLIYGEDSCWGEGYKPNQRVKWEKKLSPDDLHKYSSIRYIDREGWLPNQP
ncbi:uncharacterized protein A4U43_C07F18950 [Asparagus officinalis]|uniref:pectinesterase n=1 Tax=Asparagus officinalis TaxID=4686 RepID=A0A5P1EI91_ASPOF|nr:uncharacterized protein A4U43_C07F18950 [Asparagus officinalis]